MVKLKLNNNFKMCKKTYICTIQVSLNSQLTLSSVANLLYIVYPMSNLIVQPIRTLILLVKILVKY